MAATCCVLRAATLGHRYSVPPGRLSQPALSHHLKVLHDSGLDRDKRGVWVCYQTRAQALASLGALVGYPAASSP
jgi:hypothetical protein